MKRNFRHLGIAIAVLVACMLWVSPPVFAKDKGPVKIGFIGSYTGPFAKSGIDMDHGFRLARSL